MAHDTILEEILAAKREEVARLQLFRSAIRAQADEAVRGVTAGGGAGEEMKTEELIRRALERIGR